MDEEGRQSQPEPEEIVVRRKVAAGLAGAVDGGAAGGQLVVPARQELELMLASAEDGDSLAALERAAATLLEVAKRQNVIQEQLREVAEWGLRVKRKLGVLLAQTDARGGDRAKLHAAILLPGNLTPSAASRLRQLARIEEADFARYLERARIHASIPTMAGCIRLSHQESRHGKARKAARRNAAHPVRDIEVAPQVLDAIERCLGTIDVCVGDASVNCAKRLEADTLTAAKLQGTVLLGTCVDPSVWIDRVVKQQQSARCHQAVILLQAETNASWFRCLARARWTLCFLTSAERAVVAAYIGARTEAFFVAMQQHGLVAHVHDY